MKYNLRNYRELLNLSQSDFAKELGISQGSVCLYEAGKEPPISVLFMLKKLIKSRLNIGISLDSFMEAANNPTINPTINS